MLGFFGWHRFDISSSGKEFMGNQWEISTHQWESWFGFEVNPTASKNPVVLGSLRWLILREVLQVETWFFTRESNVLSWFVLMLLLYSQSINLLNCMVNSLKLISCKFRNVPIKSKTVALDPNASPGSL